jgi:hypothetical protein
MTPTERIQLIAELRRSFPVHHRLQVAMEDYEELAIAANREIPVIAKPTKPITSRAAYMRVHRKRERKIIQDARQHNDQKYNNIRVK